MMKRSRTWRRWGGVVMGASCFVGVSRSASGQTAAEVKHDIVRLDREMKELWRDNKYDAAIRAAEHLLVVTEKSLGPDHADVGEVLHHMAALYATKADYMQAERFFLRALAIQEKVLGLDHPDIAALFNNLAGVYLSKGDYVHAEPLFRRAVAIKEKAFGRDHLAVANTLYNFGNLCLAKGDNVQAERLFLRALAIQRKALGPEHPTVARSLNALARLVNRKGDSSRAEQQYQSSCAIVEKALGPDHFDVASCVFDLATLYATKGNYARAEPLYQRTLRIWEHAFGQEHPLVAQALHNLATLHWEQNDVPRAMREREQALSIEDRNAARELVVGTDEQRRAYMKGLRRSTEMTISLHVRATPQLEHAKRLALRTILRRKGLVIDAMAKSIANLRHTLSPAIKKKFDTWLSLNAQYSSRVMRGPNGHDVEALRNALKQLDDERQKIENELSFVSSDLQAQLKPVTIEQVQAALPEDAALVELYRYEPFAPNVKRPPRFVAYVLHPNGQIDFADLGEAKPIEDAVQAFRTVLSRNATDPRSAAYGLHQLVFAPIRKLLGEKRHIYLSPDGVLNFVPFEALVDDTGDYLIHAWAMTYLSSGRDLVRQGHSAPSCRGAAIFSNPDFDLGSEPDVRPSRRYEPLLYAKEEANAIANVIPTAVKHEGAFATETEVKTLKSPMLLHIATHGFFLKDETTLHVSADTRGLSYENPLVKSGLVFAGANRAGSYDKNDGLLTALEASQLNLAGTQLVVLSACDTGNGKVEYGDGVYGLRRAFNIAGAETIVMSLWPVEGQTTTELMQSYYEGLSKGGGRAESLRQAQLALLETSEHAHPHDWASFIVSGDDRPLAQLSNDGAHCTIRPRGCGAGCVIGASDETSAWGWFGAAFAAVYAASRRRKPLANRSRSTGEENR